VFASLRALIEAGGPASQASTHRDELLAAGDAQTAARHFSAMQQALVAGTHDGTIDAAFMLEAIKRVQALANTRGLTLPLSVQFD